VQFPARLREGSVNRCSDRVFGRCALVTTNRRMLPSNPAEESHHHTVASNIWLPPSMPMSTGTRQKHVSHFHPDAFLKHGLSLAALQAEFLLPRKVSL
jgi:hypothetical protein